MKGMGMSSSNVLSFYEEEGRFHGILGWIFSTDHKRIGLLYLVSILTFFFTGVILGFLMRLELIAPGPTIMKPQTYNAIFTFHGVIMIFLFVIPEIPKYRGNPRNDKQEDHDHPVKGENGVISLRLHDCRPRSYQLQPHQESENNTGKEKGEDRNEEEQTDSLMVG